MAREIEVNFKPEVRREPNGRWCKGQSGNVYGKKKRVTKKTLDMFTENTDKAIEKLFSLMDSPDPKIRLEATKYFLDKGLGKAFQAYDDMEDESKDGTVEIRIVRAHKED